MNDYFQLFKARMIEENLPQVAIDTFEYYYKLLVKGETGLVPEKSIRPVDMLPDSETLGNNMFEAGGKALSKTVLIKLNGGLGTGMGLNKAKSLLKVKNNLTFLDIIAKQAEHTKVPLVLMNSFSTQKDSLELLAAYGNLAKSQIPLDFLQHKAPKILKENLKPALFPDNPELEWYPPGHGDIYTALVTSGMLTKLLSAGYIYAFISNADNLGAILDNAILGYFAANDFPFMMECADRTEADKKGGHLAKDLDDRLLLQESAQCPEQDMEAFQNIQAHKYFNTNNLWINLKALSAILTERGNILGLPMIRNSKTLDPRDSKSAEVYQIETAMGSAISVFPGSAAIRVPRTRFAPVKANNDLLAVRSDLYILSNDFKVFLNPVHKTGVPSIKLDSTFYKNIDDFEERFPNGVPSMLQCEGLDIKGDFEFGAGIIFKGFVKLINETDKRIKINDNTILQGQLK